LNLGTLGGIASVAGIATGQPWLTAAGGALGAMQRMGGASMGLTDEEMTTLVKKWRKANSKIVKFWYSVQEHFVEAIQGEPSTLGCLKFYRKNGNVLIELPSGRPLVYIKAAYKNERITYYGLNQETKQWGLQDTYGGKLVENITQALARDVLVSSMLELDKLGFNIIMHVHDEIVVDENSIVADPKADILKSVMSKPISWAPGLPLGAETFIADFYQK